MNSTIWFSIATTFGLAVILPCTIISVVALLCHSKEKRLSADVQGAGLAQQRIICWALSLGTFLGVSTLLPVPFAFIIILDSAVFGIAVALSTWNASAPITASLTTVAATMLATATVVTALTITAQARYGYGAVELLDNLLALWFTFAFPGLALGLTAGVIRRKADRERFQARLLSTSHDEPKVLSNAYSGGNL